MPAKIIMNIIRMMVVTFLPFLELRASIPYGILSLKESPYFVFFICVISNIIIGILVYVFLDKIIHIFLKIKAINKLYQQIVIRTQKKVKKYVDKYGEIGIAIFIGIPLPGSGVYTGALASYLLGLGYKKFIIANIIGVIIAGLIVTAIVVSGDYAASAIRLFIKI